MAEEKTLVGGLPDTGKYLNDAYAALLGSLESRQRGLGPTLLAIAQGATAPTKTGSFGESLGNIAGSVLKQQEEERKEELPAAQMRLQLAKGLQMQDLLPKLYKETPVSGGGTRMEFDPQVAKSLASATGDPKFLQMAYEFDKTKRLREAGANIFTPVTTKDSEGKPQTSYEFNRGALMSLAQASDNPMETIASYAKMVPELRRAGLLKSTGTENTPFDAIALAAPSDLIKKQALNYAKQYRDGQIDDEKANTMANQLVTLATSHMDRQQAMQFNQTMQGLMMGLRQEQFKTKQEDKQKEKENAQVTTINAADDMMSQVDLIRKHPGRYSGLGSVDPRRVVPGTDEYNFDQQMEVLKSRAFLQSVQAMRGLGALSNAEGQRITSSISALNPKMSEKEFLASLDFIDNAMQRTKANAIRIARGERPVLRDEKGKDYLGELPVGKPEFNTSIPRWNPQTQKWEQ